MPRWQDLLNRGQTIELATEAEEVERTLPSIVEDVVDDAILVSVPINRHGRVPMPKGQKVIVFFNHFTSRYAFTSRVMDRRYVDDLAVYLAPPDQIKRFERRKDPRIDVCLLPIEVSILSERSWVKIAAKVKNVSSSGLAMETNFPIKQGTPVVVNMRLDREENAIRASGYPISLRRGRGRYGPNHQVALSFNKIEEADRERIHKYVFKQQIAMRRKGLL